jgi:hypothetical protein
LNLPFIFYGRARVNSGGQTAYFPQGDRTKPFQKTRIQVETANPEPLKDDNQHRDGEHEAISPIKEVQSAALHFHAMERCDAFDILF